MVGVRLLDEAAQGHLVRDAIEEMQAMTAVMRSKLDAVDIGVLRQCVDVLESVAKPVADHIGKMGEPLVVKLDEQIGNVAMQVQAAAEPRKRDPNSEPEQLPLTKERLLEEASNGRFVRARLQDVSALSTSVYNQLEGSNGVVRLGLRTVEKATSWIALPVAERLVQLSGPLVDTIDGRIGGAVQTMRESVVEPARQLDENHEITVGGLVQVASASASARFGELVSTLKTMGSGNASERASDNANDAEERENLISRLREMIQVGLVAYAEDIIKSAQQTTLATKSRERLHIAVEVASARLLSVKQSLGPHYERARNSLSPQTVATQLRQLVERSRCVGREAMQRTRGITDTLMENVGDAFDKTKDITESTLGYLDSQSLLVIPSEVLEFCSKFLGWRERDAQYNDIANQFSELFDSLSNVFMLSQQSGAVAGGDPAAADVVISSSAA